MTCKSAAAAILSMALPAAFLGCQGSLQGGPDFLVIDGDRLDQAKAVFDPWGRVQLTGRDDKGVVLEFRLEVPPFHLDPLDTYHFGNEGEPPAVRFYAVRGDKDVPQARGTLELRALNGRRIAFSVRGGLLDGPEIAVNCALTPSLRRLATVLENQRPEILPAGVPVLPPAKGDLVFCVLGNGGTGLPGQFSIGKALATAPGSQPELVILLGDTVLPPPKSFTDEVWASHFEQPYPVASLDVPFYVVLGDRDFDLGPGNASMMEYARGNGRWTFPRPDYSFSRTAHGKRVLFVVTNTNAIAKDVRSPVTRHSRRFLTGVLQEEADWKIVLGHHSFVTRGNAAEEYDRSGMRRVVEAILQQAGADVYLAGSDHHLEITRPIRGITYVNSGGGGGPEAAGSLEWTDDTMFARSGGGFAWFRLQAEGLQISLADSSGRLLYTRILTK